MKPKLYFTLILLLVVFLCRMPQNGRASTTITNKYDSLLVDGKYYKKGVEFYCSQNYTENNHKTYFYIAKNYGIIKKRIYAYTQWRTWELTNSIIKQ